MRHWIAVAMVLGSTVAAADTAFTAAPLAGAVGGATATVDDPPPTKPARMNEINRKKLEQIVALDPKLGSFTGLDSNSVGVGIGDGKPAERAPVPVTVGFEPATGDFSGLTLDETNRVVRARAGLIRVCYQRALAKQPDLSGKVVVRFTIAADGTVPRAEVTGTTLKTPAVEACIVAQIKKMRFPAKGAAAVVNYPFIFSRG